MPAYPGCPGQEAIKPVSVLFTSVDCIYVPVALHMSNAQLPDIKIVKTYLRLTFDFQAIHVYDRITALQYGEVQQKYRNHFIVIIFITSAIWVQSTESCLMETGGVQ